MAGGQERILRRRIRSVQATKKITRAMELIAGSRIVRAQQRVQAAVPYSEQITEVVRDLAAAGGEVQSPLLNGRESVKRVAYISIVADRGLCGGYNTGVIRATEGEVKHTATEGIDYALILVGRKAETYFRFRGYKMAATFGGFTDNPTYENAREIGQTAVKLFLDGEVDQVKLVYTRFVSAGTQEVVMRPLVPLDREFMAGGDGTTATGATYEFEPNPSVILESLLPRYVEARVYAALLNAAASEHAFRQRAMKAATDNAEELIRNLTRVMNRARQDSITTEIMEIVGGAEALSGGGDAEISNFAGLAHYSTDGFLDIRPASALAATAVGVLEPDDVEGDIQGIGPQIDTMLKGMGITTFRQIALWSPEDVERINDELAFFKGRIEREDWVGQAKRLHFEKYGEQL